MTPVSVPNVSAPKNEQRANEPAARDIGKWYTHGWLWFVMLLPFSAVLFGVVMFTSANYERDDLVVDNYYKEGKGINLLIGQDQQAALSGARVDLSAVTKNGAVFKVAQGGGALRLSLFHVSDSTKDVRLDLTDNGGGIYTATSELLAKHLSSQGVWYIEIRDEASGWRLRDRIQTPVAQLVLQPQATAAVSDQQP